MALFITVNDIKDNTAVQQNCESASLQPYIQIVQDMYIKRTLDEPTYNALQAECAASGITAVTSSNITGLTQASQNLIVQMRPAMVWGCFYSAYNFLNVRITNKGITVGESNGISSQSDRLDRIDQKREVESNMNFYLGELVRYLRVNATDYPLWRENNFELETQFSGTTSTSTLTQYDFGLYTRPSNYKRKFYF